MSHGPGTPRAVALYWILIGGLLIPMTIFYGAAMAPAVGGLYAFSPAVFEYAFYAALGWIVLYTVYTIDFLRRFGTGVLAEMQEWLMNAGKEVQAGIFGLLVIYVNLVVLLGSGAGWAIGQHVGLPTIGLVVALAYPGLDIGNAVQDRPTPGSLLLSILLGIFQALGVFGGISVTGILRGTLPRPSH